MTERDSTLDSVESTARDRLALALGPKFEVRDLLGRGGFAEVYEVHDRQLHRRLAVKVLRPDLAWTSGMLQRFEQEARALASLSHPNILPIHFVGDREGLVYYAMPFIEGTPLGELLHLGGPLGPERAVQIIRPILEALAHAHGRGMIHRDIKPDNIIVEKQTGRPLLVDFGIVKQMDEGPGNTLSGFVVGTPTYMSPEQALGQANVDHRSDLYAIGGVLFHLVTGTPPYAGETSQEVIGRHISEPVPVPTALNREVPAWLSDVIIRSLAKRPEDRYQSAAEMADALREGLQSGPLQPLRSRDSLVRQIREDDPTHIIPATPGELPPRRHAAAGRRADDPTPAGIGRRSSDQAVLRHRRRWTLLRGGVVLVALGALVYYFFQVPPRLVIRNQLALPIDLLWNTGDTGGLDTTLGPGQAYLDTTLGPGQEFRLDLPRDGVVRAQWSVERPRLPGAAARVGAEYKGNLAIDGLSLMEALRRKVSEEIDSWTGTERYLAPLVTNQTGEPVRVTVLGSEERCDCWVPPGRRVPIGYYRLSPDTEIRVTTGQRFARYRRLDRLADPLSGAVEIRVDSLSFVAGR